MVVFLTYSIKSKTCGVCTKNPIPADEWNRNHEMFCEINHMGSSGSMEKKWAVEMFLCSIDKHNFKYAEYIGDGDSRLFLHCWCFFFSCDTRHFRFHGQEKVNL